jgi:hypothetical protein
MQNMHNVFLYGKIKPVHLIVAKRPNDQNTTHFLDFAFKLLKSIKIHAKFFFHIEITKNETVKVPTIKIETFKEGNAVDSLTNSYNITNPDNVEIRLEKGQVDSYIINEIFEFETKKQQIKIMNDLQNKDGNNNTGRGIIVEKNDNPQGDTTSPLDMSDLLYKNYTSDAVFNIKINLEYTKTDAKTIIINKIDIYINKS